MSHRARVTALVSAGVFMASLDVFIVNIAFTAIAADYGGESMAALSWVLSAYAIVFAAALVPAGRWFDRVGRRRGFLAGVALFGLGSALCAAAPSLDALIAARVVQALGAALLMPTSLGLLLPEYPPQERPRAIALWTAVGGLAAAAGPPIGGVLTELDWRLIFLVNVPVAAATVVIGARILREIRDPAPGPRPDLLGAVLLVVAVTAATWAIVEAPEQGWLSARTLGGGALALAGLVAFVVRSRRHVAPVVPPAVVAHRAFRWATAASAAFFVAFAAMLLDGIYVMTDLWGWSPLAAGLGFFAGPAFAAVVASRGALLIARWGAPAVAMAGALLFALGCALSALLVGADSDYAGAFLPAQVIIGVAVGLVLPSTANAAFGALPPAQLSTGIAVYSLSRQIGTALGVALLVVVFASPATAGELAGAVDRGYWLMAGAALLAALLAARIGSAPEPAAGAAQAEAPAPTPMPLAEEARA